MGSVIGICGFSGSGKTTLILELLPLLQEKGLRTAVIKHNVPGLEVDKEGKDSDRLFKAGADVVMRGRDQSFIRLQSGEERELADVLAELAPSYDLIILEGHKAAVDVDKIWLETEGVQDCPEDAVGVKQVVPWKADRVSAVMDFIDGELDLNRPKLMGGILIGGMSRRMGEPKHLIKGDDGRTWLESTVEKVSAVVDEVVVLGGGEVPDSLSELKVLPDAADIAGPLAGMTSAMRWAPSSNWLFTACDQPGMTVEALEWLKGRIKPGIWAVMPSDDKGVHPFPGIYDFRAVNLIRGLDRPTALAGMDKVISPSVPAEHESSWKNFNRPEDLD